MSFIYFSVPVWVWCPVLSPGVFWFEVSVESRKTTLTPGQLGTPDPGSRLRPRPSHVLTYLGLGREKGGFLPRATSVVRALFLTRALPRDLLHHGPPPELLGPD